MIKGLEALKCLKDTLKFFYQDEDEWNITRYPKDIKTIEQELKEYEQHKAIENEIGVELALFFKIMKAETLWWKDKNKKYTHNIASEFISVKPYWSIGAGIVFEFSWNDRNINAYENCDVVINEKESPIGMPHIYLFLTLKNYGKTWALTKEELEKELVIKQPKRKYYVKFTKSRTFIGGNSGMTFQDNCGFCVKDLNSESIKRPFLEENTIVENLMVKEIKTNKVIYVGKDYQEFLETIRGKKE